MKTKGRIMLSILTASAALTCSASWACDQNTWAQSPAARTCQLETITSRDTGDSEVAYCDVTARCQTGNMVPEDPNSWNTPQVHEYRKTSETHIPQGEFTRLINNRGELVGP